MVRNLFLIFLGAVFFVGTAQADPDDPLCHWAGLKMGANLMNVDRKSAACAPDSSALPAQICFGEAICKISKISGTKVRLNGDIRKKDLRRLDEAKKEGKNPPSMDRFGFAVAVCETSADGACPTADECLFQKWRAGNPSGLSRGTALSNLNDPNGELKKLGLDGLTETGLDGKPVSGVFKEITQMDGLTKIGSENQGITAMMYEKGRRTRPDPAFGPVKDPSWEGNASVPVICLKHSADSLETCETKDQCVTYADKDENVAPIVTYAGISLSKKSGKRGTTSGGGKDAGDSY